MTARGKLPGIPPGSLRNPENYASTPAMELESRDLDFEFSEMGTFALKVPGYRRISQIPFRKSQDVRPQSFETNQKGAAISFTRG